MRTLSRRQQAGAIAIAALIASTAFGLTDQKPPTEQKATAAQSDERLAKRVDEYFKAWQAQDLHQVFLLYAPSYRKTTTEMAFYEITRGMIGTSPLEYKIAKITRSADNRKAAVTVNARQMIPPLGVVPSRLDFNWVFEAGDWYKLMDPPSGVPQPPPSPPDRPTSTSPSPAAQPTPTPTP
jgi:hypothetical protein